jgi:hypothetical protein
MKLVALVAIAALIGGCAQDPEADAIESLRRISEIRSGELTLDVGIETPGEDAASTGFTIDGVFMLAEEEDALPEADLTYTQRAGDDEVDGRFVSDGTTVFVEIEGERTELPADQVDAFRVEGDANADSVFTQLDVETWLPDATVEEEGEDTTITGDLDVVAALNDMFELAASFGGTAVPAIEGDQAEIVRSSVVSSSAEITAGEDGLLRRLAMVIEFGVADADLREALGPLAGATFTLELDLTSVNEPVDVG